jgi:hypothetical protein
MSYMILGFMLGQPPTEAIEELFLKYRTALTTGRLTIAGETNFPGMGIKQRKWIRRVWYDRDHFRCDHTSLVPPDGRTIYCENGERENHYVYFEERSLDPKYELRIMPLRIQTMALPPNTSRVGETEHKFDPRALGTFTGSFYHFSGVKLATLARTDRGPATWERTVWKGKVAWTKSFQLKHGPVKRMTYVPEQGNSLVKAELTDETTYQFVEAEPRKFGAKGTWFPGKLVCQRMERGELIENYTLEISNGEFNEPIPSQTFKLLGMDIPPKTPMSVHTPGDNGIYYWDGKKIAPVERKTEPKEVDKAPEDASPRRNGMATLSVSFGLLGAIAVGAYCYRVKCSSKR